MKMIWKLMVVLNINIDFFKITELVTLNKISFKNTLVTGLEMK